MKFQPGHQWLATFLLTMVLASSAPGFASRNHADAQAPASVSGSLPIDRDLGHQPLYSPVALPTAFDQISAEDLNDFILHRLTFVTAHGHERNRRCASGNSSCKTKAIIEPEMNAPGVVSDASAAGPIPLINSGTSNFIIARLTGSGAHKEKSYKVRPHDTVYWLVQPDGNSSRSRFFSLKYDEANDRLTIDEPTKNVYFTYESCGHPSNQGVEADFSECDPIHLAPGGAGVGGSPNQIRPRTDEEVAATWDACAAGCCKAGGGTKCHHWKDGKCLDVDTKPASKRSKARAKSGSVAIPATAPNR